MINNHDPLTIRNHTPLQYTPQPCLPHCMTDHVVYTLQRRCLDCCVVVGWWGSSCMWTGGYRWTEASNWRCSECGYKPNTSNQWLIPHLSPQSATLCPPPLPLPPPPPVMSPPCCPPPSPPLPPPLLHLPSASVDQKLPQHHRVFMGL